MEDGHSEVGGRVVLVELNGRGFYADSLHARDGGAKNH